jgi:hypothetical protein
MSKNTDSKSVSQSTSGSSLNLQKELNFPDEIKDQIMSWNQISIRSENFNNRNDQFFILDIESHTIIINSFITSFGHN